MEKDKDVDKEKDSVDECTTTQTKNRRVWEQWSDVDVECFFRGLAEHGKDFVNIQLHMKKKMKSKHEDDTKTMQQIRDYYNRTWRNLSKSLNLMQVQLVRDLRIGNRLEVEFFFDLIRTCLESL